VEPPSVLVTLAPILGGVVLAVWLVSRRPEWMGAAFAATAVAALLLGGIAYFSIPAWTNPDPLLWLLPLLSAVVMVVVVVLALTADGDEDTSAGTRDWLLLVAGGLLLWWAFRRYDALRLPILATDAPGWLDRLVIGVAIPMSLGLCVVALRGRYRVMRGRALHVG
jgi:hypothetical protein